MKDQNSQLDDVFHIVSRLTIIFPIVIVIVAIFLKYSGGSFRQKSFKEYSLTPTPSKSQNLLDSLNVNKKSSPAARFNLTGPLTCSFSNDSTAVNAYVKDKKILIQIDEKNVLSNYLLSGDCVHIWKKGIYSGEKICGLSQQIAIAEGLLSSGLFDPNAILTSMSQLLNISPAGKSEGALKSALNACKNESIPSSVQFEIPNNVLFRNKIIK